MFPYDIGNRSRSVVGNSSEIHGQSSLQRTSGTSSLQVRCTGNTILRWKVAGWIGHASVFSYQYPSPPPHFHVHRSGGPQYFRDSGEIGIPVNIPRTFRGSVSRSWGAPQRYDTENQAGAGRAAYQSSAAAPRSVERGPGWRARGRERGRGGALRQQLEY